MRWWLMLLLMMMTQLIPSCRCAWQYCVISCGASLAFERAKNGDVTSGNGLGVVPRANVAEAYVEGEFGWASSDVGLSSMGDITFEWSVPVCVESDRPCEVTSYEFCGHLGSRVATSIFLAEVGLDPGTAASE